MTKFYYFNKFIFLNIYVFKYFIVSFFKFTSEAEIQSSQLLAIPQMPTVSWNRSGRSWEPEAQFKSPT